MASGQVLVKLRRIYARADGEVQRWNGLQDQAVSLLGTIANVTSRLPALEDAASYGELSALPGIQRKLLSKQLLALEALLGELRAAVRGMEAPAAALGRLARDAERAVGQDARLTPAARRAAAGPVPSVDQCLEGLHEIWRMHADELRLKAALLAEVRYDLSEAEMAELRAAFAAQPNIDAQRVRDLLWVVAATAERPGG
eukprot:scaffold1.g5713.t1